MLKVAVICAQCGGTVWRRPCDLKRPFPNRFCTRACRARFYLDPAKSAAIGVKRLKATAADRFWARVAQKGPSDCWEWQGARDPKGYGRLSFDGKMVLAHRVALTLSDGKESDLHVCHSCDNPPCCNPAHLWRGTNQDNVTDRWSKGLGWVPKGEDAGGSKLTTEQVIYIRASEKLGTELARELGVANSTIYNIRSRAKWKHIP